MLAPVSLTWAPRRDPLAPVAVVATGTAVGPLTAAVRDVVARGSDVRACEGEGWLLVLGASEHLPWADGVQYLGREGGLLLPTALAPAIPASLLALALPRAEVVALLPGRVLTSEAPLGPPDLEPADA